MFNYIKYIGITLGVITLLIATGILALNLFIDIFIPQTHGEDINNYNEYINDVCESDYHWCESKSFFPKLSSLPTYENAEVNYYERMGRSLSLLLTFSEEDYESSKESILSSFSYLDDVIINDYGDYLISDPEFEYNGYNIRVVEDSNYRYPKSFGMIGYSDERNEIIFLYYYEISLDIIAESDDTDLTEEMREFIERVFKLP